MHDHTQTQNACTQFDKVMPPELMTGGLSDTNKMLKKRPHKRRMKLRKINIEIMKGEADTSGKRMGPIGIRRGLQESKRERSGTHVAETASSIFFFSCRAL